MGILLKIIFILSLWSNLSFAEKSYIFIEKIGMVQIGEEAGQNEKGDVVGIYPFTVQYKPTEAELQLFQVIIADIDEQKKLDLLQPQQILIGFGESGDAQYLREKARVLKIDYEKMNLDKQEKEVTKNDLNKNIIDKSVVVELIP